MKKGATNDRMILLFAKARRYLMHCPVRMVTVVIAFLVCSQIQAQPSQTIDSLKRNISANPGQDSFRVKSIYAYLRASIHNPSDHQPYIQEMLTISRKINFPYGIRKGLRMYVNYYGGMSDFRKSFSYADSLTTFLTGDESSPAKNEMAFLQWDMGNNYNQIGDFNKALEYYFLSARHFEETGNKNFMASLYGNISSIYTRTADTLRSMEYMQKALDIAESSDDDLKCTTFMNHANNLLNKTQFSKAQEMLDKIAPLIQKLQNTAYSQYYFYISGYLAQRQQNYVKAISNYRESLRFARKNNSVHQITGAMSLMFECLNATNNLAESKIYLDSTLLLAEQAGLKMRRKQVYDGLAIWYEKKGDHRSANGYLRKSIVLNDSLISEENNKEIASLEMRYQVAGKESEIRSLKTEKELQQVSIQQKNMLNYMLIGGALILLIVSLLSYRTYKQKQKIQQQRISELETEKQLTATEAVLKGEEQERTRLAKDLHDGLGGMLSGIKYSFNTMKGNLIMTPENHQAFERSMDMLDGSIKEMRRVAHNMMPEALVKFGLDTALKDFCNDINQSGALQVSYQSVDLDGANIEQTTSITIYRIIQELISNAIKHAAAKKAIVQVTKTHDQLAVTVEDDGKGFDKTLLSQAKGIGWTNIKHRIDFLKGEVDINSQPGKGTSVYIEFSV